MNKILNKPKAKQRIEISVDYTMDRDGWFLKVSYIEKKTENVISTHCVILKDIDNWIRGFQSDGWVIESNETNKII